MNRKKEPESRNDRCADFAPGNPTASAEGTGIGPEPAALSGAEADIGFRLPGEPLRRTFGRFALTGVLGVGGMGVVYRAWDPQLRREVALKLLHRDSPARKERLLREARAQARLEHPGICRVYEAGECEGEPYIAMQRIEGRPLSEMARGLNFQQKAEIGRQAAEALHAAHREGLIHRDIKPANLLIEQGEDLSLHAYVTDFGLVRDLGEEGGGTQSGVILGTWSYMAPEQVRGDAAAIDRRTDVYGLGATLYELCSGQPPYGKRDPGAIALAMAREEMIPLQRISRSVPADLSAIIGKCLEPDPDRRYASARDLAEELGRYLDGMPVRARRSGPWRRLGKWTRRHRYVLSAAASALLAVLGFALLRAREVGELRRVGEKAERYIGLLSGVELRLMYAYLQPAHDLRSDLAEARRRLEEIETAVSREGVSAEGPGNYVLGRGELLLGEPEAAVKRLRTAWQSGYQRPEAAYSLARALLAEQERQRIFAEGLPDAEVRRARLAEIDRTYGAEIAGFLARAEAGGNEIPIGVFQAAQAGRWEEALRMLAQVQNRLRWPMEGQALRIRLETRRADGERDRRSFDRAREAYRRAGDPLFQETTITPSYPARHEAACALAVSRLTLATTEGAGAEDAYREAALAVEAFRQVLPGSDRASRFYRQIRLIYAAWRFAMNDFAREELAEVDGEAERALSRNARDAEALRDLATAWRIRAFIAKQGYITSPVVGGIPDNPDQAVREVDRITDRIGRLQPLRAQDWHNLGAARRTLLETTREEDSGEWLRQFENTEMALLKSIRAEERFAPAHKDLGFLYFLRVIRSYVLGARQDLPEPWLQKSLRHSRRAIGLSPGYYDAWDNLAGVLSYSALGKMTHGEEPRGDLEAGEQAWIENMAVNADRLYPYFNAEMYCYLPWARFESLRGGDWEAPLLRLEQMLKRWESNPRSREFPWNTSDLLFDFHYARADLWSAAGKGYSAADFKALRRLLPRMADRIARERALDFLESAHALRSGRKLGDKEIRSIRNFYSDCSGAILLKNLKLIDTFADLAESLAAGGISPEAELERLAVHLDCIGRERYSNQAEVKLVEGRMALIRAEWQSKTRPSGSGDPAAWQALAGQAGSALGEAVRINRWLARAAAPYLRRADHLLDRKKEP